MSRRLSTAALAVVLLGAAACSGGGDDEEPAADLTTTTAAPTTTAPGAPTTEPVTGTLDQVELSVTEIAKLESPTALAVRPGSPDLYIADKGGTVRHIEVTEAEESRPARYELQRTPVLDLSDEVINDGEQGLLGLAFSSDGGRLYVDFTAAPDGRTVVLEYELDTRGDVDEDTRRQLLEVAQPYPNHNGGQLATGRDGYLYIGLGDGGSAGDPDGNGQDPTTLLGSILRIDPIAGSEDGPAYGIPAGNPFANGAGAAAETWLYGVRNPWRFSFDRANGDLWVADVGQNEWEEINHLPSVGGFDAGRGANLGWSEMEGTHPFEGGTNPPKAILPIYEYGRDDGCSITGGYVYRGEAIGALRGAYVFGDYCAQGISAIQVNEGAVIDERTWDLPVTDLQSFGEGDDGELYALLGTGEVLKLGAA